MENEKVAIEAIAEEGARAYSKTVWTETTPITADKLNKMENGIAAALPLTGGTLTGALGINGGKLTFSNQIGGGQMSSLINCQELQNKTGNGQMMTASANRIYVGNPNTQLILESGSNPIVNVGGTEYQLYHTGNKPTAGQIGALPLSGGTLTGFISVPGESRFHNGAYTDPWHGQVCAIKASGNVAVQGQMRLNNGSEAVFHEVCNARDIGMYLNNNNWGIYDYQKDRSVLRYNMDGDRVEVQGKRVATWDGNNPAHYMFRYGSGLGGANGYITFSY